MELSVSLTPAHVKWMREVAGQWVNELNQVNLGSSDAFPLLWEAHSVSYTAHSVLKVKMCMLAVLPFLALLAC